MIAYVNNEQMDLREASVPITDLGLNRGYGVFDFFRIVNGEFRFVDDHLDRFFRSLELGKFSYGFAKEEVLEKIETLRTLNKIEHGFVKAVYTAGDSPDFATVPKNGNLIISVGQLNPPDPKNYTEGVNLTSLKHQRECPRIKTTNYFFAQMHRKEMQAARAVDILYYTDYITETSRSNIYFVKGNKVYTPKQNILHGITRKKLMAIAPGITETDIAIKEIGTFDEAFITSTTKELMPVVKIDNTIIGNGKPGTVYKGLHHRFNDAFGI